MTPRERAALKKMIRTALTIGLCVYLVLWLLVDMSPPQQQVTVTLPSHILTEWQ